ncbi:MAG: nicotinamide mononucleotide transporter, partial [Chlamydiia bacterium]|nr:nicotinamide mononucleotide transporter [Chlamydiia bacterium]
DQLSWLFVFLSLAGNVFIIKKNVIGQWMWAFSNLGWIVYDVSIGAYSQAFLFTVYFGMCVWGIISWTNESKEPASV